MTKLVKFRHTMHSRNCPTNNSVCKVSKVGDCRWVIFSSGGAPYDVYKRKYVVDYNLSGKHQKDALLCILGGLSLMRLPHSVLYHLFLFLYQSPLLLHGKESNCIFFMTTLNSRVIKFPGSFWEIEN